MAAQFAETDADKASWARLWTAVRTPWERTEDLSDLLGCARSAVAQWATGARQGPWTLLRAALRETARRHPAAVPKLVEALAAELFDASGRWVPRVEDGEELDWGKESEDVHIRHGELAQAVREGRPTAISFARERFIREAEEAERAAASLEGRLRAARVAG